MAIFPEDLADRYRRFKHRNFAGNIEHYEELATFGQSPEIMLVSCCDSRVDPETIFNALPGELFVVRNVANLVPPFETGGLYHGVSAALEFAVLNLRIKHLVVMGHSGCGGIKVALDENAALQTEALFITKWMSMLDSARLAVTSSQQGSTRDQAVAALEREGVKNSLRNLRTFPFVKDREEKGKLALYGAHFDIARGTLSVWNELTDTFTDL